MLRTHRRKIKSIIAETIACTLIAIATAVIGLVLIKLASLIVVSTNLTYEEFIQAMIVISITGALVAVIKLLRENERSEKNG